MNKIFKVEWDRHFIPRFLNALGLSFMWFVLIILICFMAWLVTFVVKDTVGDKYAICKLPNGDIVEGNASYGANGVRVNVDDKTYHIDSLHCVVIE